MGQPSRSGWSRPTNVAWASGSSVPRPDGIIAVIGPRRGHLVNHLGHRCPVRVGGRAVEIAAAEVGRLHGRRKLATRFVRRPR